MNKQGEVMRKEEGVNSFPYLLASVKVAGG